MEKIFVYYKKTLYIDYLSGKLFFLRIISTVQTRYLFLESIVNALSLSFSAAARAKLKAIYIFIVTFLMIGGMVGIYAQTASVTPIATDPSQTGVANWLGDNSTGLGLMPSLWDTGANEILGFNQNGLTPATSSLQKNGNQGRSGGALQTVGGTISDMYNNPTATTGEYFAYIQNNAGFIPHAYAASPAGNGQGYQGLQTLTLQFWQWTRNIAYFFLAIVLILIAFIILVRGKVGQVEVTLTNVIPRIIMALVLITFSYAIAGFIIDLMNLGFGIIDYSIFFEPKSSLASNLSLLLNTSPSYYDPYQPTFSVWQILGTTGLLSTTAGVPTAVSANFGSGVIQNVLSRIADLAQAGAGNNGLILLIFAIASLFAVFRIFFALLGNYIILLFLPVAAPLMFTFGVLPGRTGMITWWFKRMFAAILSFIGVYTMFCFIFITTAFASQQGGSILSAPLLGLSSSPSAAPALMGLVAFGLLMATPMIPTTMERVVGIQQGGMDFANQTVNAARSAAQHIPVVGMLF